MNKKKLIKISVFLLILIALLAFILFQFIINPLGWIIFFVFYGLWECLIEGTMFMRVVSLIIFLLLFAYTCALVQFLTKELTGE